MTEPHEPTTPVSYSRLAHLEEAVDEYLAGVHEDIAWPPDPTTAERWLLVEENVKGSTPPYWLTTHAGPAEAGQYHFTQEYASDWAIVEIIDLDTGESFDETRLGVTVVVEPEQRPEGEKTAMTKYQVTLYAEVLAENEADAIDKLRAVLAPIQNDGGNDVTYFDLEGPIEELQEDDE